MIFIIILTYLYLDGISPINLQWVGVPIITNDECSEAYKWDGIITNSMICAGYLGLGGKDSCQGDSGGPLVCQVDNKAVITGVISWGFDCASADYPGVYAKVSAVLPWIESNMVLYFEQIIISVCCIVFCNTFNNFHYLFLIKRKAYPLTLMLRHH